jgi:hypothetical protein
VYPHAPGVLFSLSSATPPPPVTARHPRRALTAVAAVIGVALFVYAVRRAGVAEIAEGIRRVGWGLVLIIFLGGARFLVRAQCWRLCVPGETQLTFGHAVVAFIAGDAVGSVTPLGLLVRGLPPPLAALGSVADQIRAFSIAQPGRLTQVFLLDLVYHALAVLEVFVTLEWLMGSRGPTLAMAIVFETLNRIVTVVFKFVPFRVGIDEALTGAFAPLVAVDPASGVTLAVVRKVRSLVWAGVGLAAIVLHPARNGDRS